MPPASPDFATWIAKVADRLRRTGWRPGQIEVRKTCLDGALSGHPRWPTRGQGFWIDGTPLAAGGETRLWGLREHQTFGTANS